MHGTLSFDRRMQSHNDEEAASIKEARVSRGHHMTSQTKKLFEFAKICK